MNIQNFVNHGVINDIHDCPVVNVSTSGDVKLQGEAPEASEEGKATLKASDVSSDDRILTALLTMRDEGVLRKHYDYAFVMEVMNETEGIAEIQLLKIFFELSPKNRIGGFAQ
ncbi:MAG: hypothetical protein LKG25_04670 [Prevotella sp.]|jgi:hypothetical protein|nr:hypothetical protein [Prevotella sp.]MCI1281869.1 hypothetical protein [Prevotella sp.]